MYLAISDSEAIFIASTAHKPSQTTCIIDTNPRMASSTTTDLTALSQTLHHETLAHSFDMKWTSLGCPTSPPLIFIHGTPWSSRVWTPFALALSRDFHVYLFDNPGFGDSPVEQLLLEVDFKPRDEVERLDADLARQSSAFAALFKYWEETEDWAGKKAHVVAHDHGGLMSLRAYLLHGCAYASLCLIDVVAIGPFGQPLFKAVAQHPEFFEQLPNMAFEGILESYIRSAAFTELPKEIVYMLKEPWLREGGKAGFIRQLCQAGSRSTEEVGGRYAEVGKSVPIKIIWGTQDSWIDVADATRLGDALEARKVVTIEGAGHLIMYDQPAQLGVELGMWLKNVSM
ncbi:alpha/beta-hydrolase [Clathrospora elynae]|uniref:Alpha/beta-hydrolase n=1 Tax=Clathrospora elynae TaxID=706981 RepID=A0A6A5T4E0_9PLEO|nr:alpha/beta-hydrolase [Clathrospora elynae]